jgi:hypothetical protein
LSILTALRPLASSAAAFFGPHGAVSQLARHRQQSRQSISRDAEQTLETVAGEQAQAQIEHLQQAVAQGQRTIARLQRQLALAVVLDEERQAEFASTAQAEGIRLPQARRLLRVLLGKQTPSVAQLGTDTQAAARRATALLEVLDQTVGPQLEQVAADEIYCGRTPILMTVEPESLCWLGGRRVDRLDGAAWLGELRPLTQVQYLVSDAGNHLVHGVHLLQAERRQAGQPVPAHGLDVFHTFREGQRVLRRRWQRAATALNKGRRPAAAFRAPPACRPAAALGKQAGASERLAVGGLAGDRSRVRPGQRGGTSLAPGADRLGAVHPAGTAQ